MTEESAKEVIHNSKVNCTICLIFDVMLWVGWLIVGFSLGWNLREMLK